MRDLPISNCEREFLLSLISENKRVDGRNATDIRDVKIEFGVSFGACTVSLGNTKVFTQVSAEVTSPKQRRPNEGILFVNVELSPMAHPTFEQGRQTEESVELSRLMERCLKESRCIDLESLCIVVGEKVWTVRVDITILNHDGNMLDCASLSAISALAHFKRPDVSFKGGEVTIHTFDEKDPIPLSVHHKPICCSFAFFHQGKHLLIDPSELEERVTEGKMVIGMNAHREICMMQMTGHMMLKKEQVQQCTRMALVKVMELTELIQQAIANDKQARKEGQKCGLAVSTRGKAGIDTTVTDATPVRSLPIVERHSDSDSDSDSDDGGGGGDMEADSSEGADGDAVKSVGKGVAVQGIAAITKWKEEEQGQVEKKSKGGKTSKTTLQKT